MNSHRVESERMEEIVENTQNFHDWHKRQVADYVEKRKQYIAFAERLQKILTDGCKTSFPESVIQARAKTVASFAEKVARKFLKEWPKPDFERDKSAVDRFNDLCGARVIVQTTDQVEGVCKFIEANFEKIEKDVKQDRLGDDRVGYRDTHYVISLRADRRTVLGIDDQQFEKLKTLRAELQVRTWAQHAWADPLHDRMYKAPFEHPAATRRTSNMVAALLEESDRVLSELTNEVDGKIANFAASAKPDDLEQEIEIQKLVLKEESEADKSTRIALGLARLYAAKGAHAQVVEVLGSLAETTKGALRPTLLLQLGLATCALHRDSSHDLARDAHYQRGVGYLREAHTLLESKDVLYAPNLRTLDGARGRAAWALAQALSPIRDEGERAASLFQKACSHEPNNPYYLTDMLGFEMHDGRGGNLPAAMLTQLQRGIETCLQHAASRIQLPTCCLAAGRMALFLAANLKPVDGVAAPENNKTPWGWGVDALSHISRGIRMVLQRECCADPALLVREHAWINHLRRGGDIHKEHPYDFAMELLDLGEAVRTGGKPGRAARARIKGPVLMVAGGAAGMPADKLAGARKLLEAALTDFSGTVIAGGTKSGIPGLVGDLAAELANKKRFRLMGYRATISRRDAQPHPSYAEADVVEVGTDFSVLQTLQTWADILASDIKPSEVRVLGLGGGELAKFDYRIGLALGAQVGVVLGSGREADALCLDPLWSHMSNLLPLPDDVATLRAFVAPASNNTGAVELMAAEIHRRYVASNHREPPANLQPWNKLDEIFKRSNRHQAAHAQRILEAVGFEVRKVTGEPVVLAYFTKDEIERMAELEHGRWNVERLSDGWRRGPRNDEKRLRPSLVPWNDEALIDTEKQHDRDAVKAFPEVLAKQGLEVRRR